MAARYGWCERNKTTGQSYVYRHQRAGECNLDLKVTCQLAERQVVSTLVQIRDLSKTLERSARRVEVLQSENGWLLAVERSRTAYFIDWLIAVAKRS
jgi:hypothetical protein